ncbi:MAG: hypothetical protein ACT4PU_09360 [Planctomycetota bacterium]
MAGLPAPMCLGLLLGLLAIAFSFGMGVSFGLAEKSLKQSLEDSGTAALATAYKGDVAAKDAVVKKSWEYFQRAHLHGGGLGAAAVGCILVLGVFCRRSAVTRFSALAFGAGALLYAIFWLWAGVRAPGLGSTGAAKESLAFIAWPGSLLCVAGLLGTIGAVLRETLGGSSAR